ncbi:autotransporter outer membrane beta-barrel domain-containing protein [Herminiimonas arsenitoxidans]|uniref:autotransporter outer membrane beta-barrel domain-containing protein n=1 Tax=Herminiimonas arsenitoxidans TaxID=1809410 RepID=UPI00097077A2|nr:autotransporter outer membrane beta-barrel domain-containing protein [Herminiimonas arsenitoxidans]
MNSIPKKSVTLAVLSTLPASWYIRPLTLSVLCMFAINAAQAAGMNIPNATPVDIGNTTVTIDNLTVTNNVSGTITGAGGTLVYSDATGAFRLGGTANGTQKTLDMSGLDNFVFDNATQVFSVGGQMSAGAVVTGVTNGTLSLAQNNVITTSSFGVADVSRALSGGATNSGTVLLGQNNTINTNQITIGASQANGTLAFQSGITDGTLVLRGLDGSSRVSNWNIGTGTNSNYGSASSTVNLTGGTLDAKIDNLLIGSAIFGTQTGSGTLILADGVLDANTITLGQRNSTTGGGGANGTLTVNGGTVLTQNLIVGDRIGTTGSATGTVNLNGGALLAQEIQAGAGTATRIINWNDGIIGNYADGQDMTISGVQIRLAGTGTHAFQVNGVDAVATVNAVMSNAAGAAGTLTKEGNGTLVLAANNSYSGATTVNNGTLAVNGSIINSAVTINNGGILGGSGMVNSVTVANGGVLSNSLGNLAVVGNLDFSAGSIYRVHTDEDGNANRVNVNGNLTLDGTVDVRAAAGNYETERSVVILTNNGTQTGTFAGVTSNLAFLTSTLDYSANEVVLNLARNATSYSDVAGTYNQISAATMLQDVAVDATGDTATVINAVTALSEEQARAAYDAIGGAGLVALRRAGPTFASNFNNQLRARMAAVGASSDQQAVLNTPVMLAANDQVADLLPALAPHKYSLDGGMPAAASTDGRGFWLRAYGNDQSTDSDGNAASTHNKEAGMSVGFDTQVAEGLVLGGALTHGRSDISTTNNERGKSNGNAVAVYASYANGPWNATGSAVLAYNNNSMRRGINFGSIDRTAQSKFDSRTASLYGEVSYDMPMATWTLQPLAGFSASNNKTDGFTETGADALNLQVASETVNSFKSLLGAKATIDTGKIQWQPRLIWAHEYGNANVPLSAQMQGSATVFTVRGVDLPRDSLVTGLTVSGKASKRLSLFADVQGEFNSRQTNLGLLVGLRASW